MERCVRLCVLLLGAIPIVVLAQEMTETERAQEAVETRQAVFKLMAWNMDPLGEMARNRLPFDAETAERSASRIEFLAPMIPQLFEMDTRDFEVDTRARDGVWTNVDDFAAKAEELVTAAAELEAAAASGDRATVSRAIVAVGQACGACHDSYRDEEE